MSATIAFSINIALYSVFPLLLTAFSARGNSTLFYVYLTSVLVLGSLVGTIYSFQLSETLILSGGNIAHAAFMMGVVMLIIVERDIRTFRNVITLLVLVDSFVFVVFNFLNYIIDSGLVLNVLNIPAEVFDISLWVLILGGILILLELFILLVIFLNVRKITTNSTVISVIYTAAFMAILALDGLLFPTIAFGLSPGLSSIIIGNVSGKLVLAFCFGVPLLLFYGIFSARLTAFIETPIELSNLFMPRDRLLEKLNEYEIRDQLLQRNNQELKEISTKDALTGLANRRSFDDTLQSEWMRCQRSGKPVTLVIGDLDFFKQYNDTYGHQKGDDCLKSIARLWGEVFRRPDDLAARVGGEEFAIILPETEADDALDNLEIFMKGLADANLPHQGSQITDRVTMSIGVAALVPSRELLPAALYRLADEQLYQAKHAGRNRIVTAGDINTSH